MSVDRVDKIADAVLYEGYVLYPYRPSVKNQHRWTFGGIFPERFCRASASNDSPVMQTQCLVIAKPEATISIKLRFLHLMDRGVEQAPKFERVPLLRVAGQDYQSWQEAVEREVLIQSIRLSDLVRDVQRQVFSFPGSRQFEDLMENEQVAGRIVRRQESLTGEIEISARQMPGEVIQLSIGVVNKSEVEADATRQDALMRCLASSHLILCIKEGRFISLTDPPCELAEAAARCRNIGWWPVLAGELTQTDTLLVSPIILPDYPQIASQSPGNLFDGTEIDEILTLRIMTLTDEEKRQAAAVDDRVSQLLKRTQSLARDQLMNLHGHLKPTVESNGVDGVSPWDRLEERKLIERTRSAGVELRTGDRVRLRPSARADIFDIALAGKTATIAAIEQDLENRIHLAVTVDDDPGSDLGAAGKIGHRFFFSPDEIEPLDDRRRA